MEPFARPILVVFLLPDRNIFFHRFHDLTECGEAGGTVRTATANQDACLADRNVTKTVEDEDASKPQ